MHYTSTHVHERGLFKAHVVVVVTNKKLHSISVSISLINYLNKYKCLTNVITYELFNFQFYVEMNPT